jgi:hypothetical protein
METKPAVTAATIPNLYGRVAKNNPFRLELTIFTNTLEASSQLFQGNIRYNIYRYI